MAIKIIQDKTSKKKTTKKTAKKKSSSRNTRYVEMTMPYNTISLSSRSGSKKKKASKKLILKFVMLVFIVCLCFSSVYAYNHLKTYLCSLERFFIDTIEITGCNNVAESEIKKLIPFEVGESSFAVNLGRAEKELKNFSAEIKDISIYRTNWGKKIVVSLTERLPEVFINDGDKKLGLDFDNKPFNLRGHMFSMSIPTLVFNSDDERKDLLTFYYKIKNKLGGLVSQITEIKYGEVEDIVLTINDKTALYWGLPQDNKTDEKIKKLNKVLEKLSWKTNNVDYIDLSFIDGNKNKVFVGYSVAAEEESKA